jgi:uncharacterized protein YndB with AHSA1/START domain
MGLRESVSAEVAAPPDEVFALVTDVARLPQWNEAITEIVEDPGPLTVGAEWKVRMRAMGSSWVSRSQVTAIDAASRRFAYRSQTDDGNPSFSDWEWTIEPAGDGARVTLAADLNPRTFWRKHLIVKIRRPALRKEMAASIAAISSALAHR